MINLALTFRQARLADVSNVAMLANQSYRGESSNQGWTTEASIIDGLGTSVDEIKQLIKAKNTVILLCLDVHEIIGSLCLELRNTGRADITAHIGMFVVNPILQTQV